MELKNKTADEIIEELTRIPKKYRGKDCFVIYFTPYGIGTPDIKYFESKNLDDEGVSFFQGMVESRNGKVIGRFEYINNLFYGKAKEFIKDKEKLSSVLTLQDIVNN